MFKWALIIFVPSIALRPSTSVCWLISPLTSLNCPRSPKLNLLRNIVPGLGWTRHVFMIFFILFGAIILSRGISRFAATYLHRGAAAAIIVETLGKSHARPVRLVPLRWCCWYYLTLSRITR